MDTWPEYGDDTVKVPYGAFIVQFAPSFAWQGLKDTVVTAPAPSSLPMDMLRGTKRDTECTTGLRHMFVWNITDW